MTTDDGSGAPSEAAVRAATERWARAARVPVEVASGSTPAAASAGTRFLRGVLLGATVGTLLVVVISGQVLAAVPWVLLALGLGCLVAAIAEHRRPAPVRTVPSRS
ncbi:hypothetical protein [Blastococcus saxobsidens]|uniref:DUF3040 domain-containing protein n=1 Tax=Blastococcus saxobsidens TaxID=138336 RepID=A0A4V2G253_9ACTN|nr:hypothetical protein [Blastococcus saxobsidens]RZU31736.1 hypothetical protein BKA19_1414 [Blastococcus saxobsidens]